MSAVDTFQIVDSLVLGSKHNEHVPIADQDRQSVRRSRYSSACGCNLVSSWQTKSGWARHLLHWQWPIALDCRVSVDLWW